MEIILKTFTQTGLLSLLPITVAYLLLGYFAVKCSDFVLGLLKAWKNENYKSSKMRDGIVRWVAELVAILFVITIDMILGLNYYLCSFTLALLIYKEIGSILENLTECGVKLPKVVTDKLEVFNVNSTNKVPIEEKKTEQLK